MLDPFAQLFQHFWGHARSLRMVYKDLWVVSFPRCTAGPNIVGSRCIRLQTTANTHATTPNIVAATMLGVVASVCTQPSRTKAAPSPLCVTENLVRPNRCWRTNRNSFAWLAVVSAQTKLDKYQRKTKKFSGRAENSEVITQNRFFTQIEQFHELFSLFLRLANFENIEKNVVLTTRVMIFTAFE